MKSSAALSNDYPFSDLVRSILVAHTYYMQAGRQAGFHIRTYVDGGIVALLLAL